MGRIIDKLTVKNEKIRFRYSSMDMSEHEIFTWKRKVNTTKIPWEQPSIEKQNESMNGRK